MAKKWMPILLIVKINFPVSSVNGINLSKPQNQYFQFKEIKYGYLRGIKITQGVGGAWYGLFFFFRHFSVRSENKK
jgi:hypothetical protein